MNAPARKPSAPQPSLTQQEPMSTATYDDITALAMLLAGRRVCVVTGAGVSTDSGIPDYRGEETRKKLRRPMRAAQFLADAAGRQRYWARSLIGYERVARAAPNVTHQALAAAEAAGRVHALVTQNVDGLHQKAGQRHVVGVHGTLADVVCLQCHRRTSRAALQVALLAQNPQAATTAASFAPDGDADLDDTGAFVVVDCTSCGGILKPDVVFFGEAVRPEQKQAADDALAKSDALLVLGTSLEVYSARRLVIAASARALPIAVVNRGATRGDELATLKIDAPLAAVIPAWVHGAT